MEWDPAERVRVLRGGGVIFHAIIVAVVGGLVASTPATREHQWLWAAMLFVGGFLIFMPIAWFILRRQSPLHEIVLDWRRDLLELRPPRREVMQRPLSDIRGVVLVRDTEPALSKVRVHLQLIDGFVLLFSSDDPSGAGGVLASEELQWLAEATTKLARVLGVPLIEHPVGKAKVTEPDYSPTCVKAVMMAAGGLLLYFAAMTLLVKREEARWPTVQATIVAAELSTGVDGSRRVKLSCEYAVEQVPRESVIYVGREGASIPPEFQPGHTITLCYDPSRPERSTAEPGGRHSGTIYGLVVGGGLVAYFGFLLLLDLIIRVFERAYQRHVGKAKRALAAMEDAFAEVRDFGDRHGHDQEMADTEAKMAARLDKAKRALNDLETKGEEEK